MWSTRGRCWLGSKRKKNTSVRKENPSNRPHGKMIGRFTISFQNFQTTALSTRLQVQGGGIDRIYI